MAWLRALRAFGHAVRRGFQGMRESPKVQLLAVSTTAVCMLLLGGVMLVWVNVQSVVMHWGIDVPLTIYLRDDVPEEELAPWVARLAALPEIERIERVEPAAAMQRLAEGLGDRPELLEGITPELLPATIEVFVAPAAEPGFVEALAERVREHPAVEDVALAGAWADRATRLLDTLGRLVVGVAAAVAFASVAILWSTIRLAVYARRSEIHILRLVGGTASFVRGPFLVEGACQGALGAGVALALLHLGFDALQPYLRDGLAFAFAAGSLRFFTEPELVAGILFGAGLGLLGSRAATGRYVEA